MRLVWAALGALADAVLRVPSPPSLHDTTRAEKPGMALEADGLSDKRVPARRDEIYWACQRLFELHGSSPPPSPQPALTKPSRSMQRTFPPSPSWSSGTATTER